MRASERKLGGITKIPGYREAVRREERKSLVEIVIGDHHFGEWREGEESLGRVRGGGLPIYER